MTFESRPVFTIIPNHVSPIETSSDDGTREAQGFGAATPWRAQGYAQRIYRMKFLLERSEIRELEGFFDARRGQMEGFWLPTWNADFRLAKPVGSSDATFQVEPSGFPAYFGIHPGLAKVAFIKKDGTITPHTIIGAVVQAPYEAVQFSGTSGFSCDIDTLVSHLVYVRFNADELQFQYINDSLAEVDVEFMELPTEYAATETGERPAWLYEITQGSNFWRWTSHGASIVAGSMEWMPEDITHTQIKKSTNCFDEGVNIKVGLRSSSNPFYQFLSGPPPSPIRVKIYKTTFPVLALGTAIYEAYVRDVSFSQRGIVDVSLSSALGVAEARIPRVLVQGMCNWQLYDSSTCRVDEPSRRFVATVSAADATWIESASFGVGDNYLALGRAVFGTETRLIIAHTGNRITLNAAFRSTVTAGSQVFVTPGCDKTLSTCLSKFNNVANFGGCPYVPLKNPQLDAINAPSSSGGKK